LLLDTLSVNTIKRRDYSVTVVTYARFHNFTRTQWFGKSLATKHVSLYLVIHRPVIWYSLKTQIREKVIWKKCSIWPQFSAENFYPFEFHTLPCIRHSKINSTRKTVAILPNM